jgi:hypothetical protein
LWTDPERVVLVHTGVAAAAVAQQQQQQQQHLPLARCQAKE